MSRFLATATLAIVSFLFSSAPAQERVKKSLEDVSVTLPADEADLADPMLNLAKVWQEAMRQESEGSAHEVLRGYLLSPKATENATRDIAHFIGLKNGADEAIRRDWEEAIQLALKAADAWEAWQRGFDTMHFWTKAEAKVEAQLQRDRWVFQDMEVQVRSDGAGVRFRPSFLPALIDLEALPDDPNEVAPQRLDFVLAYQLGMTPRAITRKYNDLLNKMQADPERGLVMQSAAEFYEAIGRRVLEKALRRMLVTDDRGEHFRKALSAAFKAASNEVYNPKRGRKFLFGMRIRNIASQEWEESIDDLARRIRNTPAWPGKGDGPAELAVREVALAMVFLSLKHGGDNLNSWIGAQEKPLESRAFADRLDKAAGDPGWEKIFRNYCGDLADQFEVMFANLAGPEDDPSLSVIEQQWPRTVSGRVEVVHPPELAEAAKLAAEKVDAFLDELPLVDEAEMPPAFGEKHRAILEAHGLRPRERSGDQWIEIYTRMIGGVLPKLRLRFWFVEDALEALRKGAAIPGMELDAATGKVAGTSQLNWQRDFQLGAEDETTKDGNAVSSIFVPMTRAEASELSVKYLAMAIENKCREELKDMVELARTGQSREERFFVMASMVVGQALLLDVIASEDREWFIDGVSNWLAKRVTDAEFGAGTGQRIFEERLPAEKNEPDRDQVDLTTWTSSEDGETRPLEAAHAYFATLAIESAFEGKDADFVNRFIEEIRKTPRKRTNLGTVYRAYKTVGGGNLKSHAQKVVQ